MLSHLERCRVKWKLLKFQNAIRRVHLVHLQVENIILSLLKVTNISFLVLLSFQCILFFMLFTAISEKLIFFCALVKHQILCSEVCILRHSVNTTHLISFTDLLIDFKQNLFQFLFILPYFVSFHIRLYFNILRSDPGQVLLCLCAV